MRWLRWWLVGILTALGASLLLTAPPVQGQQILQNGFEGRSTQWKLGSTDATIRTTEHRITNETAHSGQCSEHLRLQVEKGTYLHYTLDLPRAPITEELNLGLWVKSNRPGIQLLCRFVLPRERDPKDPGRPLTVLVRADPYNSTRWKLLGLREPVKRLREQQQLLTHQVGHEVITSGAYIDRLVLNVFDGPGQIDVWIDDLEVGPVEEKSRPVTEAAPASRQPVPGQTTRRASEVLLRGNQLLVGGKRFFVRGIRHTGTPPLRTLRDAGFNVVWVDESTQPGVVEEATSMGFWIVPSINAARRAAQQGTGVEATLTSREDVTHRVSRLMDSDSILAWDLGSNLGSERFSEVSRTARLLRLTDPSRPVMADVWDGYRGYSRSLDQVMLGTHRWPLMTGLEMSSYREWLDMRRRLATDSYCWTWIQTHLPDWFLRLTEEGRTKNDFVEPIGPPPEQIRLLTYSALAAGYRGIGFWSDRFLADTHQGKDRLLAMALLNQELMMLERVLVNTSREPDWIPTSRPEVMAAVFRAPEGVLVLPIWMGHGSQFVPGQGATPELAITVPGVPITATAWELSPGRIQSYPIHRELGGITVKLRNFSLTSAILFTSDLSPSGLIVRLQDQQRRMGRLAAQWLLDQAREEYAKVDRVQNELEKLGHALPESPTLLERSRRAIEQSTQHRRSGEHAEAFVQAEIALRSLRVLMRAQWDKAVHDLPVPTAIPYAVSYYTLPRHWQMLNQMRQLRPGPTLLQDGDFELPAEREQAGWLVQEVPSLDDVEINLRRVQTNPHSGKQCLQIQVRPRDARREPAALERTYVALHSPTVKLEPGTIVRCSAWVMVPHAIRGSVDGALFFDSIGGEPLALRLAGETGRWRRYSLYRRVPASGKLNVTLALSGMGTVYFDDVRIEPLVPAGPQPGPEPVKTARGKAASARR